MSRPRNTEPQANGALARALRRRNPDWNDETVHAERTHGIQQGKIPDILINPPRRQPVIVETEFDPARTVEQDATGRLGARLDRTGTEIEGVLSVVLPESLRTGDLKAIDSATFRYATHYLDSKGESIRWPQEKRLEGGVDDLADAIEYLSLSERQLARGTELLEQVVRDASGLLAEEAGQDALEKIASDLHQEAGEQTARMAAAICVSAFVFHVAIEGQEDVPARPAGGLHRKRGAPGHLERHPRGELLADLQHCPRPSGGIANQGRAASHEPHRRVHLRVGAAGRDYLSRPHGADVPDPHHGP